MNSKFKALFVACVISAAGVLEGRAQLQAVALHSFTNFINSFQTNYDGSESQSGLLLSGTNLYGTTTVGGVFAQGSLFAVSTNGAGFTNMHSFGNGTDGQRPYCTLVRVGNKLFGTTSQGATGGSGSVFSINIDGTGYTTLHTFAPVFLNATLGRSTNVDGAFPFGGLVSSGGVLYGTTEDCGRFGSGNIFGILTNGNGFTNLHDFALVSGPNATNNEGGFPYDTLTLSGSTLYGTGSRGGTGGEGTVFAMSTNGMGFTNLHNFSLSDSGGVIPMGSVLLANGVLYGTTSFGGAFARGTVFEVNTDSTGFAVMHAFPSETGNDSTNSDGGDSHSSLITVGNAIVGVGTDGGANGTGTIFSINTNGNNFTAFYSFSTYDNTGETNFDGAFPEAGVITDGSTLYGTGRFAGVHGRGAVFALALPLPPSLGITATASNALVSWPNAAAGFDLQSSSDLANWTTVSSSFTVTGTNFVYSTSEGQPAQFFRLRR